MRNTSSLYHRLIIKMTVGIMLCAFFASCNTDEICYNHPHVGDFVVKYDWSRCPDANPSSMAAYFYSTTKEEQERVRYSFSGRDGGKANLMCDVYHAIGMNSDHNSWAKIRNDHNIDYFEIYTDNVDMLPALGIDVRSLPTRRQDASQRIAQTPGGRLYNNRKDYIEINDTNMMQTVTFYPEEATCHYNVTVVDVENIKYLHGRQIDATISGMAEGFLHGKHSPSPVAVTMPFILTPIPDTNTITSSFLTLGRCDDPDITHTITIYVVFEDGTANYYTYDVTDQVLAAPDPLHVDITIKGLKLPKPIVNGGGFNPNVNNWEDHTEDIEM